MGREESSLFISLSGSHESLSLSCFFLCILYFPLFFMSSLSTVLPFILLPDADTHTRRQSRLLVPVLSSQVPVGSGFSNVQMINGLRSLKALAAAAFSSIPPIPLVLLTFLPSPIPSMFECRSVRAHTQKRSPNAGEGRPSLSELCFVTRAAAVLSQAVLEKARALWVEGLPLVGQALALCCRGLSDRM